MELILFAKHVKRQRHMCIGIYLEGRGEVRRGMKVLTEKD